MITAIYPGSFDPITNGHVDIATRAARLFDKVIVAVFATPDKHLSFTMEERVEMASKALSHLTNVSVEPYHTLTIDYAKKIGAQVMVRGLRMSADFENEFELAMMNKALYPDLEIICFMSRLEYQFLSSSLMKEAASMGGNITSFVPAHVAEALQKKAAGRGT